MMKLIGNLFQGKPLSLEEGPTKYRSTNEYYVLHRDGSRTNCDRFVQIVKVILCIELIILIGWLGCVSFSYYNTNRTTDCGVSVIGCKSSKIDYDDMEVKNSRARRSVGDTEDTQEKCDRNASAMRGRLNSLAAQFIIGESSNSTVLELRRKFTIFMIRDYMQVIFGNAVVEALGQALAAFFASLITGSVVSNTTIEASNTTATNPFSNVPNDMWQEMVERVSEEFVNSTDPENRQWLKARGPPSEEMMREFSSIADSFQSLRACNMSFMRSLLLVPKFSQGDMLALTLWKAGPVLNQLTLIGCRDAEAQLLEDRRDRLEAIAAEMSSDRRPRINTIILLNSIESALNATHPSEVTVEDHLLQDDSGLIPWKRFVSNASLELKKEFYELVRDQFLELRNESSQSSAWEGYDLDKAYRNWTDGLSILTESERPEAVLNITIKFGKAFNLHYVEAEEDDSWTESKAPTFGTLTYLDAEPEKLGVRQLRHILNGFVRLYFRVLHQLEPCQPDLGHGLVIERS